MKTVAVALIIALALWAGVLEVKKKPEQSTAREAVTHQQAAR